MQITEQLPPKQVSLHLLSGVSCICSPAAAQVRAQNPQPALLKELSDSIKLLPGC